MRWEDCPEAYGRGPLSRREGGHGEGGSERGLTGLGDVSQQHGGKCLDQTRPRAMAYWGRITIRLYLMNGKQMLDEVSWDMQSRQALKGLTNYLSGLF